MVEVKCRSTRNVPICKSSVQLNLVHAERYILRLRVYLSGWISPCHLPLIRYEMGHLCFYSEFISGNHLVGVIMYWQVLDQ